MKHKLYLLLALCTLTLNAYAGLEIVNTQNPSSRGFGAIKDAEIKITPNGLYAQIEFTFKIGATSLMGYNTDPLEAIFNFRLPKNSFIHDSWLWLNDSIIISAAIVEKNKATAIYNGIVKRKRDPSLLYKTADDEYELHVYPMFNYDFRKVKIVYSVPLIFVGNRAYVDLPTDILAASYSTKPAIRLTAVRNNEYFNPNNAEATIVTCLTSSAHDSLTYTIPATYYHPQNTINFYYETNNNIPHQINFSTNANEGYYQLYVPQIVPTPARHVTILLDHPQYTPYQYQYYDFNQIKYYLKSYLLSNYSPTDSFNIMYVDNGKIEKANVSWLPLDATTISTTINNIPATISSDANKFKQLIIDAYGLCKTRNNGFCILLSKSRDNYSDTAAANFVKSVSSNFSDMSNKIHIINYSTYTSATVVGNQTLLMKFTDTTRGNYVQSNPDISDALRQVTRNNDAQKKIYSIDLLSNTLYYARYALNNYGYNPEFPYTETGKYYTTPNPADSVRIKYIDNNVLTSKTINLNTILPGNIHQQQTWANYYLRDIEKRGTTYFKEALDTSINNRVLCNYTAFLALETGDTIKSAFSLNPITGIQHYEQPTEKSYKIYPNPFTKIISIESASQFDKIEIYDMMGRLLFSYQALKTQTSSIDFSHLHTGIYFLKLYRGNEVFTEKIEKL